MESKFTKGEWLIAEGSPTFVYALNDDKVNAFDCVVQGYHTGKPELEANAHLIAAAPDMYKILELLVLGDSINDTTIDDEVRMLLAKARGEQ